jgi:hypothetical protein
MMGEGGLGIPNFVYNYWMPWYVRISVEICHTYTRKSTALRQRNTAPGYAPGLPIEMQISTTAPFSLSETKIKEFNMKYVKFIWI